MWNMASFQCTKTIKAHDHNTSFIKFMPSGDQLISSSWDKTIKVWEISTGYCLKTFEGHEGWVMKFDINADGTRMVSCSKSQEIIYWDLNLKSDKSILSMFEEEHENVIDTVVFIPLKTCKVIVKARSDQDQENDEQTGGTNGDEEDKQDEEEKVGDKQPSAETSAFTKRGEELKKTRERLAKLKADVGKKTKKNQEDGKTTEEVEEEIVVKDEYVASGSRDKRIKIWNAKRGT